MWKIIVIALCACAAFYLLYINGWMIINAKRAVMYMGSRRGNQAAFSSCTGYIKRVVRFRESRTYHFTFEPELSGGEVIMELLDWKKQEVMCLNSDTRSADITVDKKSRYYLVFRFRSASGNYVLNWD